MGLGVPNRKQVNERRNTKNIGREGVEHKRAYDMKSLPHYSETCYKSEKKKSECAVAADQTGDKTKETIINIRQLRLEVNEDWSTVQRKDPVLARIIAAKEKNKRPSDKEISADSHLVKVYWAQWDSLKLIDRCLYRSWESADGNTTSNLIVVPSLKVNEIMNQSHKEHSGGHLSVTKTVKKLKQRYYWVGCKKDVARWISNCTKCIAAKTAIRTKQNDLQQYRSRAQVSNAKKNESPKELHETMHARLETDRDKLKVKYDRTVSANGFHEGQRVLLYNPKRKKGVCPKLPTNWDGPYKVIKRLNDVVYRIQKHSSPKSKMKVVHVERLTRYGRRCNEPIRDEQA